MSLITRSTVWIKLLGTCKSYRIVPVGRVDYEFRCYYADVTILLLLLLEHNPMSPDTVTDSVGEIEELEIVPGGQWENTWFKTSHRWKDNVCLWNCKIFVMASVYTAREEKCRIVFASEGQVMGNFKFKGVCNIQSILFVHGFHFCKSTYSLKFICNPQINHWGALIIAGRYVHGGKKIWVACRHTRLNKGCSAFLFQRSYYINEYPFCSRARTTFFSKFCAFLLVILLFKVAWV